MDELAILAQLEAEFLRVQRSTSRSWAKLNGHLQSRVLS